MKGDYEPQDQLYTYDRNAPVPKWVKAGLCRRLKPERVTKFRATIRPMNNP